ncbi:hypothetical protein BTVI_136719 [Pitangus sulphuratus]|nr:hypothetical protein BTVI_136719 [Pitangus sulphuratus]
MLITGKALHGAAVRYWRHWKRADATRYAITDPFILLLACILDPKEDFCESKSDKENEYSDNVMHLKGEKSYTPPEGSDNESRDEESKQGNGEPGLPHRESRADKRIGTAFLSISSEAVGE